MTLQPANTRQIPDHAILDHYNKQTYLGNSYIYTIDSQEIATTDEFPILLLRNPAVTTSSFPSGYVSLFCNLKKLVCLSSGENAIIRSYYNPTITNPGTVEVPVNLRPASPNASVSILSINPTISDFGTFYESLASNDFFQSISDLLTIIDSGQSLLITVQTSSDSTVISMENVWYEL